MNLESKIETQEPEDKTEDLSNKNKYAIPDLPQKIYQSHSYDEYPNDQLDEDYIVEDGDIEGSHNFFMVDSSSYVGNTCDELKNKHG